MRPNNYAPTIIQPSSFRNRELEIPEAGNFQRAAFVADFSSASGPIAYTFNLADLIGFGTAKRVTVDARYLGVDAVFCLSDSMGDYVHIAAGTRTRFNLPGISEDTFTIYIPAALGTGVGYARVYFDNSVVSETPANVMSDSVEYMFSGSLTAAGVATNIQVTDLTGTAGLPYVSQWGYIAPGAIATALSELDVALTLTNGFMLLPVLSSNIGAAAGGGTDGLVVSPRSRGIWLPSNSAGGSGGAAIPKPSTEGNPYTYTAVPSFPYGTPAGFAAPNNVIVYLWATFGF